MFFFFNDTATTEIYTLSLHDALPICLQLGGETLPLIVTFRDHVPGPLATVVVHRCRSLLCSTAAGVVAALTVDRKSTRLNSSHANISYAVFCLKKKK